MKVVPIRILGGVRLQGPSGDRQVGGVLAERLLGALVAAGGAPVASDALVEVLWPEEVTEDPVPALRMVASRLRRRLLEVGVPDAVVAGRGTYRLGAPTDLVDGARFEALVREARLLTEPDPERAAALLEGALALWRGGPFGGLAHEPWARGTVARLDALRISAEEELSDLDLVRQREVAVVDRLLLLAEAEPLRERRWAQLATALYRLDRQAEAIRAIDQGRKELRDQLGLDPGEELRRVERAILQQDDAFLRCRGDPRHVPLSSQCLIGRELDVAEVHRLVGANRLVTVHGLGGVGKSAVAMEVARRFETEGWMAVIAELDGVSDAASVWSAVAAAVGISSVEDEHHLALAIVARLARRATLLVLDGAEAGADTVAEVVDVLLLRTPGTKVLITSRVPVGATHEVRYALDGLALQPAGDDEPPAFRLFLERAGLPASSIDDAARSAAMGMCQRMGGLPLAIELAAAGIDPLDLSVLATVCDETAVEERVRAAAEWALEVVPPESRDMLGRMAVLPNGASPEAAARLTGVETSEVRRLLAPLLQAQLVGAFHHGPSGVRYRSLEPVREISLNLLSPDDRGSAESAAVHHLISVATAVGGIDEVPVESAVAGAYEELGNVRHFVALTLGADAGLELATSMTRVLALVGVAGEGRRWISDHLVAALGAPALLRARATVTRTAAGGFFAATTALDLADLVDAEEVAAAHEEWRLWAVIRGHVAIAVGWSGDASRALDLLMDPRVLDRLRHLADPWLDTHRIRLVALQRAMTGDFAGARTGLDGLSQVFLSLNDSAAALSTHFLRSWLARATGDMESAAEDLAFAREMVVTGLSRGTQALVSAELAHLARHRDDPAALAMLAAAVDELENVGNLRSASAQRRDLGIWRLAAGDVDAGMADLRLAVPVLLSTDRRAAGVALAELSAAMAPTRSHDAAMLAGSAARLVEEGSGPPLSADEAQRVRTVASMASELHPTAVAAGAALDDEELLALAACAPV